MQTLELFPPGRALPCVQAGPDLLQVDRPSALKFTRQVGGKRRLVRRMFAPKVAEHAPDQAVHRLFSVIDLFDPQTLAAVFVGACRALAR